MGKHFSNADYWIDRFQEAALDPSQWLPALQTLADATGSARAELVGFGGPDIRPFNWVTSTDRSVLDDFIEAGGADPALNFRVAADDGTTVLSITAEDAYDRARRQVRRDDVNDFFEQHQMVFGCQTALVREPGCLIGLSLLRARADGRTDPGIHTIFAAAARGAQAAVKMQRTIERQGGHLLAGTLESMGLASLLLDGFGTVLSVSSAAAALLVEERSIDVVQNRLVGREPGAQRTIDRALRAVLGPDRKPHVRIALGEPLTGAALIDIHRLPEREWAMHFAPHAIVVLQGSGSARRGRNLALLGDAFRLTAAEVEVAVALCDGESREAIAARRGVSMETLRTQMRSLYSKTGCSRETELVLLLKRLLD